MKKIFLILIFILAGPGLFQHVQLHAQAQDFDFSFKSMEAHKYSTTSTMKLDMDMRVDDWTEKMGMDISMQYDVKITPLEKLEDGSVRCKLEPENIMANWDMIQAGMHIKAKLENDYVYGTVDGTVFIDTKNDVGTSEAKELKKELAGLYLSGEMTMTENGDMADITGSIPFEEFWKENMEAYVGFFGIVFNDEAIAVGEKWEVPFELAQMGELRLSDTLKSIVSFKREADTLIDGTSYQYFTGRSPFNSQNLKGKMSDLGGDGTIVINDLQRTGEIDIIYDNDQGILISNKTDIDGDVKMSMTVEGQEVKMDMIIDGFIEMKKIED
ncbi:MAG: hypothetical protein K9G67_14720 [Bacteroidales bacterium]|nr:hypothetical protein [Bacteroidales bacterium]MCF8345083.1 hypothetical protein [Bacteroidales bacterium]MCF8351243.1 hypothetical protein [Bacteroidales bacterium]MCF8377606.1 hypothetical protein [Bacteroidales bacterium]MCF8401895.1 hypothetical protein [Bacteroidales bacterium]